ncbi:MAG: hypothetical protein A2Y17_07770 [Clostridiales bacterium GWF2_38_85]|nr:MAG: hypothetical protein A2Y17_07770 [Clostridiales bacterium GWF2_38_85]HBL84227.1 hypothetical protein [Clostridiales bacterium]
MEARRNAFFPNNKQLFGQIALYAACVLLCLGIVIPLSFNFGANNYQANSQLTSDTESLDISETESLNTSETIPDSFNINQIEQIKQGIYKGSYDFEKYFDSYSVHDNYIITIKDNNSYYYSLYDDKFRMMECRKVYKLIKYNEKTFKIETDYIIDDNKYYVNTFPYYLSENSSYEHCVISAIPNHEGLMLVQLYLDKTTNIVFYDINTDTVYDWLNEADNSFKDKITSYYTNEELANKFISPDGSKIYFSSNKEDISKTIEYYYDLDKKEIISTHIERYPFGMDSFAQNCGFIKWIDNENILYSKIHTGVFWETGDDNYKAYSSESTYDLIRKNIFTGEEFILSSDVSAFSYRSEKDFGENGIRYYIDSNNIIDLMTGEIVFTLNHQPSTPDIYYSVTMKTSPDGKFGLVNIWEGLGVFDTKHTVEVIIDFNLKKQVFNVLLYNLSKEYADYGSWITDNVIYGQGEVIILKGPFESNVSEKSIPETSIK